MSSETSAIRTQTPGNYPKRNKLHLEHGESLKTRINRLVFINETESVYCAVRTEYLNIVQINLSIQRVKTPTLFKN